MHQEVVITTMVEQMRGRAEQSAFNIRDPRRRPDISSPGRTAWTQAIDCTVVLLLSGAYCHPRRNLMRQWVTRRQPSPPDELTYLVVRPPTGASISLIVAPISSGRQFTLMLSYRAIPSAVAPQ